MSTVAKGAATQVVGQIVARSVLFFFTIAITNVLSTGGYGLYRKVAQVLGVAGQLGLAGFNYAAMRFIARARARLDHGGARGAARTGLVGAGIASVIVCALLLLLADPLGELFSGTSGAVPELARLLRIGAPYVPAFALMQVLRYCSQAYKTMVPSVIVGDIIQPTVRATLGVAVLLAGFDVAGAVVSLAFSMAIGAVAGALFYVRMLSVEERSAPRRADHTAMVRFALPQAGATLLGIQSLGLGVLVLGALGTNREVALFAVALSLQGPGDVAFSGMIDIWAPVVSDLHSRGDIVRLGSLYRTITRWIATFSFPMYAALIIESGLFVKIFGSGYAEAAAVVAILAVGSLFHTAIGPTVYVLSMTGRPGVNLANSVVAVSLYVSLGVAIVPEYGAVGMAAVNTVVTGLVNLARLVETKVLVGIHPFGWSLLKPVAASMIGGAVLLAWKLVPGDSVILASIGLIVGAATYLGALRAFGLDPEERYVWEHIRRRMFRRGKRANA